MRAATSVERIQAMARGFPAEMRPRARIWFDHPDDVVEDRSLSVAEKRALLASWASDASAVRDEPTLRWLLGTPAPVGLDEIRNALSELDDRSDGRTSR